MTLHGYRKKAGRNLAIDALRGLAVILMVEQHLGFWFWDKGSINASMFTDYPVIISLNTLGGLAAPLFIAISGFCSIYYHEKLQGKQMSIIMRGFVIMGYGYLLNLIVPSWFSLGSWYVLHIIGLCLVMSVFMNRLSTTGMITAIPFIIIIAVLLQIFLDTPPYIGNTRMGDCSMPGGVFRLAIAEGHFPVFPWAAFFISGMIAARWNISGETKKILKLSILLIVTGLLLAITGFVLPDSMQGYAERAFLFIPNFYPAAPPITLVLMGIALLGIYCSVSVFINTKLTESNFLVNLGRVSITVLVFHVFIFRQLFQLPGWRNIFGQWETLFLISLIILAFGFISVIWRKFGFKFSLEWLMRKVTYS